jgi:hypothetical protein
MMDCTGIVKNYLWVRYLESCEKRRSLYVAATRTAQQRH